MVKLMGGLGLVNRRHHAADGVHCLAKGRHHKAVTGHHAANELYPAADGGHCVTLENSMRLMRDILLLGVYIMLLIKDVNKFQGASCGK